MFVLVRLNWNSQLKYTSISYIVLQFKYSQTSTCMCDYKQLFSKATAEIPAWKFGFINITNQVTKPTRHYSGGRCGGSGLSETTSLIWQIVTSHFLQKQWEKLTYSQLRPLPFLKKGLNFFLTRMSGWSLPMACIQMYIVLHTSSVSNTVSTELWGLEQYCFSYTHWSASRLGNAVSDGSS